MATALTALVAGALLGGLGERVAAARQPKNTICVEKPRSPVATTSCGLPRVEFRVEGRIAPTAFPARERKPATIEIQATITKADGSTPAALRKLELRFDRAGKLDLAGLRRGAVIGGGTIWALGTAGEALSIPVRLLVESSRGEAASLAIRAEDPFGSGPVAVPLQVRPDGTGPYGLIATTSIPPLAGGEATLTGLRLHIGRSFAREGRTADVIETSCPDGTLSLGATAYLEDGAVLSGAVLRPCAPRR